MSLLSDSYTDVLNRHRGPFRFQMCREQTSTRTRPLTYRSDMVSGTIPAADVLTDAYSLLTDPRDTITAIYVWSDVEQQHVTTLTQAWAAAYARECHEGVYDTR